MPGDMMSSRLDFSYPSRIGHMLGMEFAASGSGCGCGGCLQASLSFLA